MNGLGRSEAVGILPVGALGVALFYHLTRELQVLDQEVCFVERAGAPHSWAQLGGSLAIACEGSVRTVPLTATCRPGLLACAETGSLPAVLLVCPQSDQILSVMTNFVELFESLFAREGLDAAVAHLPLLVLCSNGIYHQRVRRFLVEALEESTLYGRLPDLWSEAMGSVVGKLLRGVTMQTGQREGQGTEAIYRPGPPGLTRVAGGDPEARRCCAQLLQRHGGRFESVEHDSATRVEFDKALVNLFANLLGQFKAIDERGIFRPVRVRDIFPGSDSPETRELAHHVIAVGRAVKAYQAEEDFESIYRAAIAVMVGAWDHVPSSIKWIESQLSAGSLLPQITPTERWLLEPLLQYASAAGLEESARYFRELIRRVEKRLALAIETYRRGENEVPEVNERGAGLPA
jgi:hypothetical protein